MEANTEQKKWFIPCCNNEECHICKGTGKQYLDRCPVHYYNSDIKTLRFLYEAYQYKNILPFSGTPIEQPRVLFKHFEYLSHYIGMFEGIKRKEKEDNSDMSARINALKPRV